jgi:hypothetical protein
MFKIILIVLIIGLLTYLYDPVDDPILKFSFIVLQLIILGCLWWIYRIVKHPTFEPLIKTLLIFFSTIIILTGIFAIVVLIKFDNWHFH